MLSGKERGKSQEKRNFLFYSLYYLFSSLFYSALVSFALSTFLVAYSHIVETGVFQFLAIQEIAAIDDHGIVHQLGHLDVV